MKKLELQVSFVTPAFLGNAEQQGQWRTPPFKALLRQWWRVAVAKDCKYDANELRRREAELFGSAADDKKGGQSKVRLRLGGWEEGDQRNWTHLPKVCHLEVDLSFIKNREAREDAFCPEHKKHHLIDADVYLGFGPVGLRGLGKKPCISAGSKNNMTIAGMTGVEKAVQLAAWFGTLGSRCRNGWGSCQFRGTGIESSGALLHGSEIFRETLPNVTRPLSECLRLDWPHAFGSDNQGVLIWKTQAFDDWQQAMKRLAEVKITFRTSLKVNGDFQDRHLLAYPVTHHSVHAWGNQARLANQIRFKVVCNRSKYVGLIFHLPCDIPSELKKRLHHPPSQADQLHIWQSVHQILDNELCRLGGLR